MDESILAPKTGHAERQVLDGRTRRLTVNRVPVYQSVLKHWCYGVDVILAHVTNVLEHEAQGLQHTILDVELRDTVFVHKGRQDSERTTSLRNDGNSDGCTDTHLPILNLEVVEQRVEDVLWTDSSGNVAERAHSSATNGLLMGFEHFQQLEADSHPLLGRHKLGTTIGNPSDLTEKGYGRIIKEDEDEEKSKPDWDEKRTQGGTKS